MHTKIDFDAALSHFKTADPRMAEMLIFSLAHQHPIERPVSRRKEKYFESIVASIVSQQISTKAADSIYTRVKALVGDITPERVLAVRERDLRACGLSGQKTTYIRHNAEMWHTVPFSAFSRMENAEIIAELTKLHGIGAWTAEMFLMFSLARADIFSYGDWGLMQSLKTNYNVHHHWKRRIESIINAWSPHKTVASLVLWHHKDT